MNDLIIFVLACDKYEWIYRHFFRFAFDNLPLKFLFFTEKLFGNVFIPLGKLPWNERLTLALKYIEDFEHCIYLQEDFLIKNVNIKILEKAYEFHKRKKAYITKLGTNYEFNVVSTGEHIEGLPIHIQNFEDEYLLSHQPVAIFNRKFLLDTISKKTDNASMHEWEGSRIMRANNWNRVFTIGPKFNPNKSLIFEIEHGLRGGVLLPEAKRLIENFKEF